MPKHIHFLGIAGIGVSALAQLAQARDIRVSGSDPNAHPEQNPAIARLQSGGATLYTTHRAENVAPDVDLIVASAAVGSDNPEVRAAQERGIEIVSRAEFLGQLMAAHRGPKIAVAGTHGKTTTTGMIGVMLQHAGLDPTVFVGGEVPELGGNVRVGSPDGPFVAEACEAYDSFLYLKPDIAVITNIEADHLDHYGSYESVQDAFIRFIVQMWSASADFVVCADDMGIQQIIIKLGEGIMYNKYAIDNSDVSSLACNITYGQQAEFHWKYASQDFPSNRNEAVIRLNVPGKHNVLNALAAATIGNACGLSGTQIADGLAQFRGATRRQEILGEGKLNPNDTETVLVMDDYAHHPTEIRATLDALRGAYPARRLVAIFQPHLYSRTRDFLAQFAAELAQADVLLVTDIYAAREQPIDNVCAQDIVDQVITRKLNASAVYVQDKNDLPAKLTERARPGDVCVFMGAGDIREPGERFVSALLRG